MPALQDSPAATRLSRLEGFLAQDPANPHLLAETCETALAAGQLALAQRCIAAAERLQALAREKGTPALQQARRLVEAIEALAETDT